MTLLEKYNNKLAHKQTDEIWVVLLKQIFVYIAPIIAAFVLFITMFSTQGRSNNNALNQTLFFTLVPMIFASLFLIQKWELIGAYGESILLLIPTFVWLLPASQQAMDLMVSFSFAFALLTIFFACMPLIYRKLNKTSTPERKVGTMVIFSKISFMCTSLISTVLVSIIMIHWAESMGWNYYDGADKIVDGPDLTNPRWIAFISIVTLITALSLIFVGLVSAFEKGKNEIALKQLSEREKNEKTAEILHKKKKQRRERLKSKRESESNADDTSNIVVTNKSEPVEIIQPAAIEPPVSVTSPPMSKPNPVEPPIQPVSVQAPTPPVTPSYGVAQSQPIVGQQINNPTIQGVAYDNNWQFNSTPKPPIKKTIAAIHEEKTKPIDIPKQGTPSENTESIKDKNMK